jgi:flagellar basal-body rod modification protein FlgD
MTAPVSNKTVTADVSSILNPANGQGRQVTADVSGDGVSSAVSSTGDTKLFDAANKALGKQDFLNLLVTQLKYQDPLQPTENTEFVAQLAQFSNLEGTQNINTSIEDLGKKIEDMVSNQTSNSTAISNASATNLVGKFARVNASDIAYVSGQKSPISLKVHTDAGTDPVLSILDKDGEIVNVLPLQAGAETQVDWDGTRMDGKQASTGNYTLKVTSRDGTEEAGYAFFEDRINGISYAKDGVRLEINGQKVGMDQVVRVGEEPAAAQD